MTDVSIYVLCDPRDGKIRYVGQTIEPNARLYAHCNRVDNQQKSQWIEDLAQSGLIPEMRVVCVVGEDFASQVEKALICAYMTEKQDLVNKVLLPEEVLFEKVRNKREKERQDKKRRLEEMRKQNNLKLDHLKSKGNYQEILRLKEAADLAVELLPESYPDKKRAHDLIRTSSYRNKIPGAYREESSSIIRGWDSWRYNKSDLIEWLADSNKRRSKEKTHCV